MAPRFFLSALPTPALPPERRSRGAGAGRSELGCDRVAFLFAEAGRAIGLAEESERDAFWRSSCSHAGVQFEIDLPNKKVSIESTHSVDTLLETLKKTGKNTSYLGEK
uniref:Uncharacterized protein n=1 Tax=Naja naja TaxID=35670 RepID=A0A8C6XTF1_NAJNA